MPHVLGTSVDACLWNEREGTEVAMKSREDGPDALLVDFYKGKIDEQSRRYHELQTVLIETMQSFGFRLGRLREYFHFDYRPQTEPNYP
jgi:D-alanyl-D-alanine dipeptidase